MIITEPIDNKILLRPAAVLLVERYSNARKAEFLLNNAISPDEYARAVAEVRRMGLNPGTIQHEQPLA